MEWKSAVTAVLAAGLGAIVGTLVVPLLDGAIPDRQLDTKLLETSVGILREPAKTDDDPMRSWAIRVVEKKSGIAFSDQQRAVLLKRTSAR